jgi:primosomal protein N' (replication factor Y)
MSVYVEVVVNVPQVSGVFHYHLPPELFGQVDCGSLVTVPFGHQTVQGVVLRTIADPTVSETKPVHELLDTEPVLTPDQITLAQHMAHLTLTPLSACISLMLPPGLSQMADTLYQFTQAGERLAGDLFSEASSRSSPLDGQDLTDAQRRFLALLHRRGPLRGRQIDRALPRRNWQATARALGRRGLVTSQAVLLSPSVRPKKVRTVQLACSHLQAESQMENLGRQGSAALTRRQAMLRFLLREPGPVNVSWVYAESGGHLSDLRKLAQMGLVFLGESEVWRDPLEDLEFVSAQPPPLTQEQESVWEAVAQGLHDASAGETLRPFLLYGVTGSGKTEIYLRAVQAVLDRGEQAIVLVPEIALTPQTVRRFVSRFPGQVGLVHSQLSSGERYDTWRRARAGLISVVVGPRSALFTPFSSLGLIVIDECHDDSYYQSEMAPNYHAREIAAAYARQLSAVCLMGSATPDVTSTFRAARGTWTALSLPERILAHREAVRLQMKRLQLEMQHRYRPLEKDAQTTDLPPVNVVDMREELKSGNRSIFSRVLRESLRQVLDHKQQAILFLNRRGMATYVFCRDCGYTVKCPRCDVPLTYHLSPGGKRSPGIARHLDAAGAGLICHRCGYRRKMPVKCPQCASTRIRHYGMGTERVESEVHSLFPGARTLRWDWETTRQKGAHDVILEHFVNHRADVVIGTQMLAKGLDLPLVTLVGVVLADLGLSLPDYRAAERSFQVLTQVAGRAGRSPLGGQVILQTFQPEHYVIQAAAGHNYRDFYRQELDYRRRLGYPPFSHLVRLEYRDSHPERVESAAQKMAQQVQSWLVEAKAHSTEIIGPVPCFFSRVGGVYRWQIVLRGPDPVPVLRDRNLRDWRVEVDPPSLL